MQACGEVAWTKYHGYGRDNTSTLTELLASFFVLYHKVVERWSRERSTGLRYSAQSMFLGGGCGQRGERAGGGGIKYCGNSQGQTEPVRKQMLAAHRCVC